jgi:hypothetical protein
MEAEGISNVMKESEADRLRGYRKFLKLERELGDYLYRTLIDNAHAPVNHLDRIGESMDKIPGHRILCDDIPEWLVVISRAVKSLDRLPYRAWFLKVVWDRHQNGREVTNMERAKALKLDRGAYRSAVSRARRSIRHRMRVMTN